MITLNNKRVHDYIVDKDNLVNEGRQISRDIETIEIKVRRLEEKEKKITSKVIPPKEWTDRGDAIIGEINKLNDEVNEVIKKINDFKLAEIPQEIKDNHLKLLKEKEVLERSRNKIALKVQKIKDRLIPIVQKEVKPLLLDEFDDVETAKAKDGKVVINTFNHLEEYKKKFRR